MVSLGPLVRGHFLDGRRRPAGDGEGRPFVKYDGLGEGLMNRPACQHHYSLRGWRLTAADTNMNAAHVNIHLGDGLARPLPKDDEYGQAEHGQHDTMTIHKFSP